jgi:amino acid permease
MTEYEDFRSPTESQKSSTFGAAINLSKLAIGTGVLALPYATSRGGLLFGPICLALIAIWNGIACRLMIECKRYCQGMILPRGISSTYSKIAYVAIGQTGVRITDFSIIITLLGVCVVYQITFATLLVDIPGIFLSKEALTILSAFIVFPFCIPKDLSVLSAFSFIGLVCLMIGIFSILVYGFYAFCDETISDPFSAANSGSSLTLFPPSFADLTLFVGIATFCFGLPTLAFPVEESMDRQNSCFLTAVSWSLVFVWVVYVAIGVAGSLLFIHDPSGINDNILANLPENSLATSFVRLSMALVSSCLVFSYVSFCV